MTEITHSPLMLVSPHSIPHPLEVNVCYNPHHLHHQTSTIPSAFAWEQRALRSSQARTGPQDAMQSQPGRPTPPLTPKHRKEGGLLVRTAQLSPGKEVPLLHILWLSHSSAAPGSSGGSDKA